MELVKIHTDKDFENAIVPEGQILTYISEVDGEIVTKYKDHEKTGIIAGSNSEAVVDVTLGQVNAEGKFQPLAFNGIEASNSGNPEAVEAYYVFNGVLPVPDSGGVGGSAGCDFYKCTAVHGPQIISFIAVSGAGVTDCNGNYSDIGISKNGQPVYSYTSSSGTVWYIYFTTSEFEGDSWVLSDNLNVENSYNAYYYGSSLYGSWYGGEVEYDGDKGSANVSLEYSVINAGQDKTWDGYKLITTEGGYILSDELTTGLIYAVSASSDYVNDCIIPKVGGVYNSDCTAEICDTQFVTDDALTFTAEEEFSTVMLVGGTNFDWSGIRYSLDGRTWQSYTSNTVITLQKIGDFVKFDNTKSTLAINQDSSPGGAFKLTGKVEASGELKSMLNYSDYWPKSCFSMMFRNQNALTSAPVISCATLGSQALDFTFNGCNNLKKAFVKLNELLPSEDDGTYLNVDGMFGGCSSLSVIEVDFTSWEGFDTTYNGWVNGVSTKGVFVKPSELPEEYGEKRIPNGWIVVNK